MRTLTIRTFIAALALTIVLLPSSVLSQEVQSSADSRPRRFSISIQGGAVIGGGTESVEQFMREIGYDFTKPGQCFFNLCGGPTSHPHSKTEMSTILAFKYRFWDHFAAQFVYAKGGSGETDGWASSGRGSLSLTHHVTTVAALATLDGGNAHLGLGPALYSAKLDNYIRGNVQSETKLGLLADAGFEIPLEARFFIDLRLQYRFVGSAVIDPPEWLNLSSAAETISPIEFSHGYIGVGFGIRF